VSGRANIEGLPTLLLLRPCACVPSCVPGTTISISVSISVSL